MQLCRKTLSIMTPTRKSFSRIVIILMILLHVPIYPSIGRNTFQAFQLNVIQFTVAVILQSVILFNVVAPLKRVVQCIFLPHHAETLDSARNAK